METIVFFFDFFFFFVHHPGPCNSVLHWLLLSHISFGGQQHHVFQIRHVVIVSDNKA